MEDAGLNLVRGGDGCGIALTCLVMSFVFVLCLLYFAFVLVFQSLYVCSVFYLQHGGRETGEADGGRDARSSQVGCIRCLRVV